MRVERVLTITATLLAATVLPACKGSEGNSETPMARATTDAIGVAECDEYVTRYEKCASENVPAAARAELKNNVTAMRASWKQAAANPAAHAGLARGCKQALVTARTAMASYDCEW